MGAYTAEAFFLSGVGGKLFAIHYQPTNPNTAKSSVLLIPPFSEEMNKSRRTFSLLSQSLASQGVSVLLLDLFACGDSEGEFREARWDIWQQDMGTAAQWLRNNGADQVFALGLRMGALLALDVHCHGYGRFDRLILWAPVVSGQLAMTQFLRLRLAASLMGSGGQKETTKSLSALLENGELVEIAGYELPPALFTAINGLQMATFSNYPLPEVDWLELISAEDRPLPPASQRIIDAWRQNGVQVNPVGVVGEPFWSTQEITVAPGLIDRTLELMK